MSNYGIILDNIQPLDKTKKALVAMGDSILLMRKCDDGDAGIKVDNTENLTITRCKIARLGGLKLWLIRKLMGRPWSGRW